MQTYRKRPRQGPEAQREDRGPERCPDRRPRQEAQTGGPDRRPRNHKKGAGKETGRTQEEGKRLKTYAKRYEKPSGKHKNEVGGPEASSNSGVGKIC